MTLSLPTRQPPSYTSSTRPNLIPDHPTTPCRIWALSAGITARQFADLAMVPIPLSESALLDALATYQQRSLGPPLPPLPPRTTVRPHSTADTPPHPGAGSELSTGAGHDKLFHALSCVRAEYPSLPKRCMIDARCEVHETEEYNSHCLSVATAAAQLEWNRIQRLTDAGGLPPPDIGRGHGHGGRAGRAAEEPLLGGGPRTAPRDFAKPHKSS